MIRALSVGWPCPDLSSAYAPMPANTMIASMALPKMAMLSRRIGRSVVSGSPESSADTTRRVTNR